MLEVPVLIAGGGPVGLTLSLELARLGIKSMVAEQNSSTTRHPKMDLTNGRSMELFRRLGLAEKLRAVGIPPKNPFNISWITDLSESGHELCRFPYMSAEDEAWRRQVSNDGSLTLEAPLRVSQIVIEPVLKSEADINDHVQVCFGWKLESFNQDADGVTSLLRNTATGEAKSVRSRFLIGCDGGSSSVRAQLGVKLEGKVGVARLYMVHFRSRARDVLQRYGIAWHYQNGRGALVAQDDNEYWTLHAFLEPGADESAIDPRELVKDWVGCDFEFEVMVANPWSAHYVVAEQYRQGNVFIAGDACHQYMPTGGYGMNSGIADACNLGWKISAVLRGWGGEALLDSYEQERRPVAKLSWATSEQHLAVRFALAELYQSAGDLSGNKPEDIARRAAVSRRIADLGNAENEGWGTEHGYRYESAIIMADEKGEAPAFSSEIYTPTTWPGSRLPHMFLPDGQPIFDLLGPDFTLLVLNGAETDAVSSAARELGMPLKIVHIDNAQASQLYERALVLVRPDQHVAWRGDHLPDNPAVLLAGVAGRLV